MDKATSKNSAASTLMLIIQKHFDLQPLDLNIAVDIKLTVPFNNEWLLKFVMTKTESQILNTNRVVLNIILDSACSDWHITRYQTTSN